MSSEFERLENEIETIRTLANSVGVNGFFAQEVLRFYSIAGSFLNTEAMKLDETATNDERYMTHILMRSLLENYFTIIYLFDEPNLTADRYNSLLNSFKKDYKKLMNDLNKPAWQTFMVAEGSQLEAPISTWSMAPELPNVNDMLLQVKNDYGDKLNYLYLLYRITSFDTHGKSLGTIFEAVFGKQCNFPALRIKYAIDLIANQYLAVLHHIHHQDEVK